MLATQDKRDNLTPEEHSEMLQLLREQNKFARNQALRADEERLRADEERLRAENARKEAALWREKETLERKISEATVLFNQTKAEEKLQLALDKIDGLQARLTIVQTELAESKEREVRMEAELGQANAKLDLLVVIGGHASSIFPGVTPETKEKLEVSGTDALADKEAAEQIEGLRTGNFVMEITSTGNERKRKYHCIEIRHVMESLKKQYGFVEGVNYGKSNLAKYLSIAVKQFTGVLFKGKFPASFDFFLEFLGYYYCAERVDPHKY